MDNNKIKKKLLILFLLAFSIRLVLLLTTFQNQGSGGITEVSLGTAINLAQGNGFSVLTPDGLKPNDYELPGYPLYLSVPIFFFGKITGLWVARIIQMMLSALLGVFLCFSIGRRLFNNAVGLIFAGLWSIFLPEALLSTYVLHDAPMPLIALSATYFFIRAVTEKSQKYYYISAILIGIGSLIRTDILLLPTFFLLSLLIWDIGAWKRHFINFILMGSIIFLMLLPWGVRNYIHFGNFSMTRNVLWQSVWEGFGEFPNPIGAVQDDYITVQQVIKEYGYIDGNSSKFQQIMKEKVIQAVREHPLWFATMLPKRLFNMVVIGGGAHGHEIFSRDPYYHYASSYKIKNPNGNVFGYLLFLAKNPFELFIRIVPILFRGLILLLAFVGTFLWRKDWQKIFLVFSVYAYGILAHLPIYWEPRYIIPTEFPLLLLAALCIYSLARNKHHSSSQLA